MSYQKQLGDLLSQNADHLIAARHEKLRHLVAQVEEGSFVLFGAGILGRTALTGLRKLGYEPLAFSDNSPDLWGKKIEGVEVFSPEAAKAQFGNRAIFVVTIYTSAPVRRQLKDMQVKFISFAELSWEYSEVLLPHYALDLPRSIFTQSGDVYRAMDIWGDDASKNEYLSQIAWRTTLDFNKLPVPTAPMDMYFPSDLFSFLPEDTIVDCGAFDGDTIRTLLEREISYRRLIAIEPDPYNCQKLESYLLTLPERLRAKISIRKNAVDMTRDRLRFAATGTPRSGVDSGLYEVNALPLDELLAAESPSYIKMDIEGAEYRALKGGENIIQKHLPILAICLYHCPEDLWRIPLLIRSMSSRYRLYLRRYADECWEQVCYAIPIERTVT